MTLYVIWSCLDYCPPTFYNLSLLIDSNRFSPQTGSTMIIVSTVSVQSYLILTFILMTNCHRRTKLKKPASNESALKKSILRKKDFCSYYVFFSVDVWRIFFLENTSICTHQQHSNFFWHLSSDSLQVDLEGCRYSERISTNLEKFCFEVSASILTNKSLHVIIVSKKHCPKKDKNSQLLTNTR